MSGRGFARWVPVVETALYLAAFLAARGWDLYRIPVFALIAFLLLRRAGLRASDFGLTRAQLSGGVLLRAIGAAVAIALVAWYGARPLIEGLTGQPLETEVLRRAVESPRGLALMLCVSWILAAFGEEWCFRGYPLTRLAAMGPAAPWLGLVASAMVFGLSHSYQGPSGMWLSGTIGVALGALYLASGRNLWLVILAHGFVDTIAMVLFHIKAI